MRKLVRRWYWWLPALILAAAVGSVGCRATHPPWADTEAWQKYQEIQVGMPAEQVEDVVFGRQEPDRDKEGWQPEWQLGNDMVMVQYTERLDGNGFEVFAKWAHIAGREFSDSADDQHWWDRLRARLGW
jgi:hypothetical protein